MIAMVLLDDPMAFAAGVAFVIIIVAWLFDGGGIWPR